MHMAKGLKPKADARGRSSARDTTWQEQDEKPPNKPTPSAIHADRDSGFTKEQLNAAQRSFREQLGTIMLALMHTPRYRHMTLSDLTQLAINPLLKSRIAFAYANDPAPNKQVTPTGLAIWASVSDDVDAKIRSQIETGALLVRLQPGDWTSGSIIWLLDIIAPSPQAAAQMLSNFPRVAKAGDFKMHPAIKRLVDEKLLWRIESGAIARAGNEHALN
jgi:cytolysin-activating lysine-acyltransferase